MTQSIAAGIVAAPPAAAQAGSARNVRARLRRFARRRLVLVGAGFVLIEVVLAVAAPVVAPFPPNAQDFKAVLQAPSAMHVLGTDDLGRDILSRLLFGSQLSLLVGTVS